MEKLKEVKEEELIEKNNVEKEATNLVKEVKSNEKQETDMMMEEE